MTGCCWNASFTILWLVAALTLWLEAFFWNWDKTFLLLYPPVWSFADLLVWLLFGIQFVLMIFEPLVCEGRLVLKWHCGSYDVNSPTQ